MFHQFDYRWATYNHSGETRDLTDGEKGDASFSVQPRYWVSRGDVENKLSGKWDKDWLLGFRDICRSTDERTAIFSLLPKVGIGNTAPVLFSDKNTPLISCLIANLNNLIFDFVVRQKVGGTHLTFTVLRQLPVLPPESYTQQDIEFITPRVLELVYTAWDMQPFAKDMGYEGEPFSAKAQLRTAILRAELDPYYAKLYGLTRDELRYILDPADVYGEDFPSQTFRVLKNNEIKQFGEYRTQKLVWSAWDKIGL
jgi:hypothetical protein